MNLENIPKQSLGFFPTPIVKLTNLSETLDGPEIFMKRDDNTGLALGGNKTRKLEFILGDALACGADTIITAGAAQSNHCRQTAAAAARLQLECHLVLGGEEPATVNGNLLLDQIFGSHIHWAGNNRKGEGIPQLAEQLRQTGRKPYIIPYGGSNKLGALAFTEALKELEIQRKEAALSFTHIVFASSSGSTHAGLMLGKKILDASYQIVGIKIDKEETGGTPLAQSIISLANNTAEFIAAQHQFSDKDLILEPGYIGDGYGVMGALENEAISLTAQTEGILLDPVYTGRAMGGLFDMIRSGKIKKTDKVLFWHTGGTAALFAYSHSLKIQQNINKKKRSEKLNINQFFS